MISKTKAQKRIIKKTNPVLVETMRECRKNKNWFGLCKEIFLPSRKRISINLDEINKNVMDGEVILIAGKVLSQGEIDKKIKIIALEYSDNAKEKLEKSKTDYNTIINEIKKNPDAKGVKLLK